ncbi:MAG: Hpt domain-containing protein, partial [Gracilibacteraceae bacterium]|nr:Hpt domain-containing protein [Gracilibacteraceae bacterium]
MSLNNGLSNMTMPDVEEFLEFYLLDSQEQIERLGASILDLERDSENIGLINELFRSAHSLKGASGTMGFTAIVEVTHAAEDLLDKVRQGKQPVTHDVIDVLLEVTDVVKDMLAQVEAQQPVQHEAQDLVERIRQLAKGKKVEGTEIQPVMKDVKDEPTRRVEFTLDENAIQDLRESTLCGQAIYQITVFLDEEALMKTVRAVMVIQRLQELGKVLAVAPTWEEMELLEEEDQQIERFCVLLASDEPEGEIASEVFLVSDVADARLDVFDSQEISLLCGIDTCVAAQSPITAPSSTPSNSRGVTAKTPKETPKKPPDEKAAKKKPSKKKDKAANEQADFEGLGSKDLKNAVKTGNCDVSADNFGSAGTGSAGTGSAGTGSAGAGSAGAGGGEGSGSGGPGDPSDPGGPGDSGGPGGSGGGRISDASNQVHTIRVDTDRMDSLINMVGEMVITRARLVKIGDDLKSKFPSDALVSNLNETNIYLGRLMNDLQESAMRLRMVPVGTVFSRYPRLVRDFCRKTGKKIDLELHGEDTEMDKTVIEQIGDPLTHLIRN